MLSIKDTGTMSCCREILSEVSERMTYALRARVYLTIQLTFFCPSSTACRVLYSSFDMYLRAFASSFILSAVRGSPHLKLTLVNSR